MSSLEAELAAAGFTANGGGGGGGGGNAQQQQQQQQQQQENEAARNAMLKQILTPEAKERLERVRLVKPDNARAIEEHVIRLARAGKLADRIDEDTLKRMLEEVSGQAEAAAGAVKKVKIIRKKHADDEDDDDEDF